MRNPSVATRSIRLRRRSASRVASRAISKGQAALQVFIFRGETFLGTELFDSGRPIMVGRHHDAQLQLDGETVSRYHCRISVVGAEIFAEDLQSGNGTLVNRGRLERRTALKNNDQVHVGPYSLRVKLLTAPGPRPFDPSKSEDTTKINAILAAERTGTLEVGVEVDAPSFNEALYRDAIRRSTGGEKARPLPPVAPLAPEPQAAIEGDSTQMAAEEVALHTRRPEAQVEVTSEPAEDSGVEARLRDLDALIASLDAEDRSPSRGPWPAENTAPTTTELDLEDAIFSPSALSGPIDTREFARDLASRLALDGQLVPEVVPSARSPKAQIIPIRPATRVPTPVPQAPLDEDEDPTEAELMDPEVDMALAAAALLDDENPETDVFEGGVPPQIVPKILAPSRPTPVVPAVSPAVQERTRSFRDPAASGPARVPTKGLFIPRAPVPAPVPAPAAAPQNMMDVACTKPVCEPPTPAAPDLAKALPPPLPRRHRNAHAARLMTPTSLRVGVTPMKRPEESQLFDDVWTNHAPATPPPLPKPAPRRATEARPKSRMDDFSEAVKRLPDAPIPMHWDGIEVSARVQGKLVDIAVLRKGGEEYILGHRTPQGAIAPASAHIGLRLVRINDDNTVDLVFPRDVGGHLVRGPSTVTFSNLAEGRKYSCLRLETRDVATVALGAGPQAITYHVRFLHRPMSLFRSLRGLRT